MKNLTIIILIIIVTLSCQKRINYPLFNNMEVTSELALNTSIILAEQDCAGDAQAHTYVCFESVVGDSRCPEGAECFWAGNAEVKFRFVKENENPVFFNLNTNPSFTNDTIISGYKFTLKALEPYPALKTLHLPKSYKAEIEIERESR